MLLIIEIFSIFTVLILAILWIKNPSGNYEPWTVVCGVITAGIEIYRRCQTKSYNKSDQMPKISEESIVDELLVKVSEAVSEVVADRLAHPRLARMPLIELHVVKLDQNGKETDSILDLENLQLVILANDRIIIEAPAGRGKTTTLIQLAECYCKQGEIAFLINLPALVISHLDILEFISKTTPFLSRGIKSDDIARLCREKNCIFLLNGWNEISDNLSGIAVHVLVYLEENFPKAKIIIATRTHHIPPPLPEPLRLKLLSFNSQQRTDYLQKELGNRANDLDVELNSDNVLDDLTRTPLFLVEITKIYKSNNPIPKTKMGVLNAVIQLVEQSSEHQVYLTSFPLRGFSQYYLAELAIYMLIQGEVIITEQNATRIIASVSQRLKTERLIETVPEPIDVLRMLCAHHVLERLEYTSNQFKFEHQQFQEFYAALEIKSQLYGLVNKNDLDEDQNFIEKYLNMPLWEEPLRMIAEEISQISDCLLDKQKNVLVMGKRLIELTLLVDPVFAAELAQLCGSTIWKEVRDEVGKCLRSWYRVKDDCHKQCALAGMLASGSEDFIDILLPLFTSDDEQIRLTIYRIWDDFHVSSLGRDWRNIVKAWKDEYRATFIGEVLNEPRTANIAEEFALTDPSPKVRATALQALQWIGDNEAIERVLSSFDDEMFEQVLSDNLLYRKVPSSLQQRAILAYGKILEPIKNHIERLRIQLKMIEIANKNDLKEIKKKIKEDLIKWPSERIDASDQQIIISALKVIQKTDSDWVSQWIAEHIIDGSICKDCGMELITNVSENFKKNLLKKTSNEKINQHIDGVLSFLAKTANIETAEDIFSRLYKIQVDIKNDPNKNNVTNWAIYRQLEDLFLKIPQDMAVSGLLNSLSVEFNLIEFEVTIMIFGTVGIKDSIQRIQIPDNLRQALRSYLRQGVSFILSQEDFSGEMKANLAVALSRIGVPEDMADLYRLIQADIKRRRRGRAAIVKGEHNLLTNGAMMGWSNWYVQAVMFLDSKTCEEILLKILYEPEYEQEAARALVKLARIQNNNERHVGVDKLDYCAMLEARSQLKPSSFDEDRRNHYISAIKQQIALIMEQRLLSDKPNAINGRLKELAYTIAILDGRESTEYVLEILALPGDWDGWIRVETLKVLLLSGARLQADLVLNVLNPVIVHAQKSSFNDQQAIYLLNRCLCLLPYVDPPSVGITRIKEIITTTKIFSYQLREIITALGYSRTNDALDLLLELVKTSGKEFADIAGEWIDAIYELHTQESKQVLLSFVDPDIKYFEIEFNFEYHDRERLAAYIADIAQDDTTINSRLNSLCTSISTSEKRHLLANVMSHLGTSDALIAGLNLIHDNANPQVPYELKQGLENAFLEKRPYGDAMDAYTLEPRNANEIRSRLFNMVLNDENRKLSAMALLGQIELWRLEHGRPSVEPRHPALESGNPWPPIAS